MISLPKGPTATITGSFRCSVQTTQPELLSSTTNRNVGSSRKTSTSSRGRKLLTAEEPEMLRPHCDNCGYGEALRPGLDCRCHCPQCTTGKPRCSSPRMAIREEETCESFSKKLAMTKSRSAARRVASMKSIAAPAPASFKEERMPTKKAPTSACSRAPTRRCETVPKAESTIKIVTQETKPEVATKPALEEVKEATVTKKMPTIACSRAETKKCNMPKKSETCKTEIVEKTLESKQSSRHGCKRGRSGAPMLELPSCLADDNTSTKYRRPHCHMCSQLGCLRNVEVVCYCDACQEQRGAECSSPRMAEFRKSHPGYVSRSGKTTHTY